MNLVFEREEIFLDNKEILMEKLFLTLDILV